MICHALSHQLHAIQNIIEVNKESTRKITGHVHEVDAQMMRITQELEGLWLEVHYRNTDDVGNGITEKAAEIKARVDKASSELVQELSGNRIAVAAVGQRMKAKLDSAKAARQGFVR